MKRRIAWPAMMLGITLILLAAIVGQIPGHGTPQGARAVLPNSGRAKVAPPPLAEEPVISDATPASTSTPVPPAPLAESSGATAASTAASVPAATPVPTDAWSADGIECQAAQPGTYQSCLFHDAQGSSMVFYLFVPVSDSPSQQYPLVLLMHGGGERYDLAKTPEENRDRLINDPYVQVWGPGTGTPDDPQVQAKYPSFVVVPQVQYPERWLDVPPNQGSYTLTPEPTDRVRMSKEIVDALRRHFTNIDGRRLYITGLSMGGYGAWDTIERWPDEFAAAAPICGAGDPSHASDLASLPIWAFHGADDPIIPASGSRDMIAAIRAAGGNPRYTEYAGQGHGVWENAYSLPGAPTPTPRFYDWLFAQRRATPAPLP